MRTLFEVVSQQALPLVRALTSKKLMESGLSQKQVADRLGLTQPAISQYKRSLRGKAGSFSEFPQVMERMNQISTRIAAGETDLNAAMMEIVDACRGLYEKRTGA